MGTLLRGATVLDGTGAPATVAELRIEDGLVTSLGAGDRRGEDAVVDLDGLMLAPGFIDIHTHYDAQILWDSDLTPSSWHGVTTAVLGNCGFTLAPTRPTDRATMVETLATVEGMSITALEQGIDWEFESFPEYLNVLDRRRKRINVAGYIGHSALRLFVLGDDATTRPARPSETRRMRALVAEAIRHGAIGFSTSQTPNHIGANGQPVPSRAADADEIAEVALGLADAGRGVIEVSIGPSFGPAEAGLLAERTGRPVTWTALMSGLFGPSGTALEMLDRERAHGTTLFPQVTCQPFAVQFHLDEPLSLVMVCPPFREAIALDHDGRCALYRDEAWRGLARDSVVAQWRSHFEHTTLDETARHSLVGATISELADRYATTPLDVLLDVALAENLTPRFRMVFLNDDHDEVGALLTDDRCIVGLSDAGAHMSQICDAKFATHLLGHWVRETGVLDWETAVWRLTGQPAGLFGLARRGRIEPGAAADLVAFDPERVGTRANRRVHDLPGGADRLVADSEGIEHVWVNGVAIRSGARPVESAWPGAVLRG
jgi:N-acyl-D-amino-acid deacylase